MADLRLRPIGPFDLQILAALHAASFTAPWDQPWRTDSFAEILAMPGASGLLLAEGDEPLGFIVTRRVLDEMEIILLAIHPGRRQAGLGHRLAKAAIDQAADGAAAIGQAMPGDTSSAVRSVFLEYAAPNRAAERLYRGLGFVQVGRRRGYYQGAGAERIDAVTMRLDIGG